MSNARRIAGRVTFARNYLADLHDEALSLPEGAVGTYTTQRQISDAIDALDRAAQACPNDAEEADRG